MTFVSSIRMECVEDWGRVDCWCVCGLHSFDSNWILVWWLSVAHGGDWWMWEKMASSADLTENNSANGQQKNTTWACDDDLCPNGRIEATNAQRKKWHTPRTVDGASQPRTKKYKQLSFLSCVYNVQRLGKERAASKWVINVRCGGRPASTSGIHSDLHCECGGVKTNKCEYASRIEMIYSETLFSGCWVCPSIGPPSHCALHLCADDLCIVREIRKRNEFLCLALSLFLSHLISSAARAYSDSINLNWLMRLKLPSSTNRNTKFYSRTF